MFQCGEREGPFCAAIQSLDQRASRTTSICSRDLNNCDLDEYKTEYYPVRVDEFDEDPNSKCEGTYDRYGLKHAFGGSENECANG